MITIEAPTITLDQALQSFIRLSLYPTKRNMVLLVPAFEMQKFAWKRLEELLGMLPGWLCEPMVRHQQGLIEFTNGNCIRIINSSARVRGISIDHCAVYMHQDFQWTKDDWYTFLPAIKGPLDQHLCYVTE